MARHPYKTNFRHIIITLRARLMELERVMKGTFFFDSFGTKEAGNSGLKKPLSLRYAKKDQKLQHVTMGTPL